MSDKDESEYINEASCKTRLELCILDLQGINKDNGNKLLEMLCFVFLFHSNS